MKLCGPKTGDTNLYAVTVIKYFYISSDFVRCGVVVWMSVLLFRLRYSSRAEIIWSERSYRCLGTQLLLNVESLQMVLMVAPF